MAVIDPTRGALLGMLTEKPSLGERIDQGGIVGYAILALGAIGILFALYRFIYLMGVTTKVRKQLEHPQAPSDDNPLGRILSVCHSQNPQSPEDLEVTLDDAIIKEIPKLEAGHGYIKLLAAIAPLMGLLGTVTGMIETFQAITLFGTGDPKLMAGGISQALVTTVLGLVMAIPLLFAHSLISGRSKAVIQILDEQSAGLLASRIEERQHGH